ncbi:hypothetical protein [Candidatus Igneacidithiobacillus taiwanensis]|uniref:hypothetical protein n=1 Tax=Candidatus Igneacidithiobacillus taiwanensis TaxID=1945924 RepID=UPI002897226C|nr:hypothetical protein [Candidatus Igneacidithiobacillus taiwanensis]
MSDLDRAWAKSADLAVAFFGAICALRRWWSATIFASWGAGCVGFGGQDRAKRAGIRCRDSSVLAGDAHPSSDLSSLLAGVLFLFLANLFLDDPDAIHGVDHDDLEGAKDLGDQYPYSEQELPYPLEEQHGEAAESLREDKEEYGDAKNEDRQIGKHCTSLVQMMEAANSFFEREASSDLILGFLEEPVVLLDHLLHNHLLAVLRILSEHGLEASVVHRESWDENELSFFLLFRWFVGLDMEVVYLSFCKFRSTVLTGW